MRKAPTAHAIDAAGWLWAETPLEDWIFAPDHAIPLLENHFGVLSLEGFGLAGKPAAAARPARFFTTSVPPSAELCSHVDRIGFYERQNCLVLDAVTVRNLELVEPLFAGTDAGVTLFRSIDATITPMGKRLLRSWMLRPSIDTREIDARLDAVEAQVKRHRRPRRVAPRPGRHARSRAPAEPGDAGDGEPARCPGAGCLISAKIPASSGQPRSHFAAERLHDTASRLLDELGDLRQRIESTIVPEPPISFSDGGVIQAAIDAELDELRDLSRNSKQYLAQIEQRERQRTGISSLKVKFNSVFGYYLEISKANLHLAPADYERKQTLVNAERFTTPELKEYESKILDAQEKIVEIERRLFAELRSAIAGEARRIRQTALALAEVDVLAALAHIAANCEIIAVRQFDDSSDLEIVAGRHPVIEQQEIAASRRAIRTQ